MDREPWKYRRMLFTPKKEPPGSLFFVPASACRHRISPWAAALFVRGHRLGLLAFGAPQKFVGLLSAVGRPFACRLEFLEMI